MMKVIAVADAYGAGFEFCDDAKILEKNDLSGYCNHELYGFSAKYTDDTQMSIAIAEFILEHGPWSAEAVLEKIFFCFKRDPRRGYSSGFYELLQNSETVEYLLKNIHKNSDRNGAAVRAMPIGLIPDRADVVKLAKIQATATHDSESGIASSCAVALAVHFGTHLDGNINDLKLFLKSNHFGDWEFNWRGRVSVKATDTVSAALSCLMRCRSLSGLLRECVALGGDTDSVSSIAVGIANSFPEYEKDIPQHLFDGMAEPMYGLRYLDQLDEKLAKI